MGAFILRRYWHWGILFGAVLGVLWCARFAYKTAVESPESEAPLMSAPVVGLPLDLEMPLGCDWAVSYSLFKPLSRGVNLLLGEALEGILVESIRVEPFGWEFEGYIDGGREVVLLLSDRLTGRLLYVREGQSVSGTSYFVEHFSARAMDSLMNMHPGELVLKDSIGGQVFVLQEGVGAYQEFQVGLRVNDQYIEFSSLGESRRVGADVYTLITIEKEESSVCVERSDVLGRSIDQIWVSS